MGIQIFNTTMELLKGALNLRSMRHNLIAANMANNDTPLYQAVDLSFEDELKNASKNNENLTVARTNLRHLQPSGGLGHQISGTLVLEPSNRSGNDLNTVDLDREMAKMAQNTVLYNATVQILAKKMAMLRYSIDQGGR